MAGCLQTLVGIASSCDTNLAGIKKVYLANSGEAKAEIDASTHTITGITMETSKKFVGYSFAKQTGSLTSTITKDETNGVRYYTNEIALQFNKMEAAKHLEIEALAAGELVAIVLDNNGKYWYVGHDSYLSATDTTAQSGQSFDDLNGYNITMSAMSAFLPFEVTKSIVETVVDAL